MFIYEQKYEEKTSRVPQTRWKAQRIIRKPLVIANHNMIALKSITRQTLKSITRQTLQ